MPPEPGAVDGTAAFETAGDPAVTDAAGVAGEADVVEPFFPTPFVKAGAGAVVDADPADGGRTCPFWLPFVVGGCWLLGIVEPAMTGSPSHPDVDFVSAGATALVERTGELVVELALTLLPEPARAGAGGG